MHKGNSIFLWQRASVNSYCYHLDKVFSQMPLLFRKETERETEMQWPSPDTARFLLCSSNFPAVTSQTSPSKKRWTTPTPQSRMASSAAHAKLLPVSRESQDSREILLINTEGRLCSSQSPVRPGHNSVQVCMATHVRPAVKVTLLGHKAPVTKFNSRPK